MKVYCNCKNSVNFGYDFSNCDIAFFGFNGLKKINYKNELNGTEKVLKDFSNLSKKLNIPILSGTITENYGIIKNSCIVVDKGKLLGISDSSISVNDTAKSGSGNYKIYKTSKNKFGVLINDDIIDVDGVKSLAYCDADVIFFLNRREEKPQYNYLIRAYSYLFGIPFVFIGANSILFSNIEGEICGGTQDNSLLIDVPIKKTYRLITTKQRGVWQ